MGGEQGGCEWRSEAFVKIQKKKKWGGGGGRVVGSGWGEQDGCEWRSEALVKIQKKMGGVGGVVRGWVGLEGGSGWMGTENCSFCENSIKKKLGGGGVGSGRVGGRGIRLGVRVDVNREVKFFKKKNDGGGGRGRMGVGGVRSGVGVGEVGVARFGGGGVWGM